MSAEAAYLSLADRQLLARVAAWPECPTLADATPAALAQLAQQCGVDFATALLYDRLRCSAHHSRFVHQIDALLHQAAPAMLDVLLAVAPGAFYAESPNSGADGRLVRERAAAVGCRTALIPTRSMGTVAENARLLSAWLAEHAHERIVLVSLSKGAADIKAALAVPCAAEVFRPVVAWLNLSGLAFGSPVATWVLGNRCAGAVGKALCWWRGLDFAIARELAWGAGSVLDFPVALPAHIRLINVVGFPLRRHFTSAVLRFFHDRIALHGPNDGLLLLAEACALPGVVYPVWGADHNLRPAWEIGRLVGALASYLAETRDGVPGCVP